jgi:hypothetical protein
MKDSKHLKGHGPTDSLEPLELCRLPVVPVACSCSALPVTTRSYLIIIVIMCSHGPNFAFCVHIIVIYFSVGVNF